MLKAPLQAKANKSINMFQIKRECLKIAKQIHQRILVYEAYTDGCLTSCLHLTGQKWFFITAKMRRHEVDGKY